MPITDLRAFTISCELGRGTVGKEVDESEEKYIK